MYRTLLAEDEPAAMRYLRTLIESHFPELSIVATATNGKQALEQVEQLAPDLVITDVKMPIIDGLELVERLKESRPKLPVVIVSGHDDFEYARRALNTGVVDYVLKPVTARRLSEVFQRIAELLRTNADEQDLVGFKRLLAGDIAGDHDAKDAVRFALLRCGAPPSRFARETSLGFTEQSRDGFCTLLGRDEHEALFLASTDRVDLPAFASLCRARLDSRSGHYYTMLINAEGTPAGLLSAAVDSIYRDLDRSIIIGENQMLRKPVERHQAVKPDRVVTGRIEEAVINSDLEALEALVGQELGKWRKARLPAIGLQNAARSFVETVQQAAVRSGEEPAFDPLLEQLLVEARTVQELETSLSGLVGEIAGLADRAAKSKESASIFTSIRSYLESTYAQPHSVESIRARYRISASYLAKLFRLNTGHSFNEYLTVLRVEAAKRLLLESPETPIKNVARYVGYRDPFYFSRVFRSTTGESPTEFLNRRR